MSNQPKILAFAGSSRIDSFNKKLVKFAVEGAKKAGAEVRYIDLLDYPMPLFNEDLEKLEGLPQKVREFKHLLREHQGFLISCPEYNGSITPLLKNAIDWASRSELNEKPLSGVVQKRGILGNNSQAKLSQGADLAYRTKVLI